jgi:chromosome segregation ATPase
VIKVPPLILLFLIQFLLMFLGLSIFLFLRNKKLRIKEVMARGEASRLRDDLKNMVIQNDKASGWENKFSDLQTKFEQVKIINERLKESINKLIPEANRTKEHQQVIRDIEQSYIDLDSFIGTLRKEKEQLHAKTRAYESDMSRLSQKLNHSVPKEEYDKLKTHNKSLELKFDKMKKDLEDQVKEYNNLQKNFVWLEKEYNALYNNISQDRS